MTEIERWFNDTYGGFGFYLGPMIYDPYSFVPMRKVIHPNGFATTIKIMPEMANDISGGFVQLPDPLEEFKSLISGEMERLYGDDLRPKQIEPILRLKKFKLKQYD